jgi:hypothetical protein
MIYMSATFFIFMSAGPLKLTLDQKLMLWMFNLVPNMIKNLLFGIAFYKPMVSPIDYSTERQG